MIFNIIIIILVLMFSYQLYKKRVLYFVCFLPFLVQYLWMFMSILVIEQGVYINEQDRDGEFVFANFYLFLFFIVSLISFVFFFQLYNKTIKLDLPKIRLIGLKERKIILIIAIFILCLAYLNLLSSPSSYTDPSITKFNYWENAKYPGLKVVLGSTIGYMPFIFGLLFKNHKKLIITLIILYLVYLVGLDQKFTAFLSGLTSFILSYVIANRSSKANESILSFKKRYLILVSALLFSLVLIKYTYKNSFAYLGFTPVESVFYRAFGLQAHLFWGVSERYIHNDQPNTWDIGELAYGMHVLMEDFTPQERKKWLESSWERGVSWTNGYPAILIRMFPLPIALLVHFFMFSIPPLIYMLLIKLVRRKNYLTAIIFFQMVLWLLNIYSMSYFYRLNKIIVIFVLIGLTSYFINKSKPQNELEI